MESVRGCRFFISHRTVEPPEQKAKRKPKNSQSGSKAEYLSFFVFHTQQYTAGSAAATAGAAVVVVFVLILPHSGYKSSEERACVV